MFLEWLSIHFTWNTLSSQVAFLDIDVYLDHSKSYTSVHVKPTNLQEYLQYHIHQALNPLFPCHSGEGGCICIIATLTTSAFTPPTSSKPSPPTGILPLLQKQLFWALHHLNPNSCPHDLHHFSLTTTYYYPGFHHPKQILREAFLILSSDPSTQDLLTKPPSDTFHKVPNLHQLIFNTSVSSYNPATPTGSQSCNRPHCNTCPIYHPANFFTSFCTNVTYPITTHVDYKSMNLIFFFYYGTTARSRALASIFFLHSSLSFATCLHAENPSKSGTSMNLIYQLQCTECNAFYIGETCHSLSDHMNGLWFTTMVSNPDPPVNIFTVKM